MASHKLCINLFICKMQANRGFRGQVTVVKSGEPVPGAEVKVENLGTSVYTASGGDYWTHIAPGVYTVTVSAKGYATQSKVYN